MSTSKLDKLISDLYLLVSENTILSHPSYVETFENYLAEIVELDDSSCIGRLIPLFDDKYFSDDSMFSIVHSIENFEDSVYVQTILENLSAFYKNSPGWASTVLIRILNSGEAMTELSYQAKKLSPDDKSVLSDLLREVAKESSSLEQKTFSVLASIQA